MKIAIVTDTNSGMTPDDAGNHGIILESMPVIIDGKEYREGVNLDDELFYSLLADGAEIHTSQPSAGDVLDLWKDLLKDYDEVVHIPMSSGLSGSCQSAVLYSQEFDGRVHVVDNQRISVTQRQSALDAAVMAANGMDGASIKRRLEETKALSHIYITVDTLKYLKKGGRITPAAAMIAGVLNIKPVLQIQGDKLDAYSKCRGIKLAKKESRTNSAVSATPHRPRARGSALPTRGTRRRQSSSKKRRRSTSRAFRFMSTGFRSALPAISGPDRWRSRVRRFFRKGCSIDSVF